MNELNEKAARYLKIIIRNSLANSRGLNPVDISDDEVNAVYENDALPGYKLHQQVITGYVNGREEQSIVAAIIDIETGDWYYSQSIR
jgi:hypothetical protein